MQYTNSKLGVLSIGALALVLMGAGCMMNGQANTDTSMNNDAMMAGDEMNEDENMVGGDAMIDGEDAMMEKTDDAMMGTDDAMIEENGDTMMEAEGSEVSAGMFTVYDGSKVSMAADGTVVLAFLADWCPTCRAVKSDINANIDAIPTGLTILDVNYDDAQELRRQYGVITQHTFVQVDAEGNAIKTWRGGNTLQSIVDQVS